MLGQKVPCELQTLLVNSVAETGPDMPFYADTSFGESIARHMNRINIDDFIDSAMDQLHRWASLQLCG